MGSEPPPEVEAALTRVVREESGRILGALIHTTGDFDLAEDALQDAVEAALRRWPADGAPPNPGAWLTVTARRRAIDRIRRDRRFSQKLAALAALLAEQEHDGAAEPEPPPGPQPIEDERLRLIFTCCHPALAPEARVALTLRTLGGLSTAEIAQAFLVPESTMAQRLVRAKRKIRDAAIPYRVPDPEQWPERLDAVLTVVYLIYNEGYAATGGPDFDRPDLAEEAIRLGRVLLDLLPDEAEVRGLLALLLLQQARRPARVAPDGALVTLEQQDRRLWDRERIAAGEALLAEALRLEAPGPYQVQAAIAALHDEAPSAAETDWPQIALLYGTLAHMQPGPMVTLNRAAAVGMAGGPAAGLHALDEAAAAHPRALPAHHLYHAARADFLRRAGRMEEAAAAYEAALGLVSNEQERRYLRDRLREVRGGA